MSDEHGHNHHDDAGVNGAAGQGCVYLLATIAFVAVACIGPVLLTFALGIGAAVPVITVFGEPLDEGSFLGDIPNTMWALLIVDLIIILIAYNLRNLQQIPSGFQNGFELVFEYLYNQTKTIVGAADARKVFPVIATLFLVVLVANVTKIIPGYESVGLLHCAKDSELVTMSGYPVHGVPTIFEEGGQEAHEAPFITFLKVDEPFNSGTSATELGYEACEYKYLGYDKYEHEFDELNEELQHEAEENGEENVTNVIDNLVVAPFFRGASTDLNFTFALAVFAVFFIQYFGVQALGFSYFTKFVNLPAIGNVAQNPIGAMDFVVGILEILSELSKILSFAFRLFGVMFAGGILLIVALFLAGSIVPVAVLGLELFVGLIQAYVFFILPLVLIKIASSHH